MEKILHHLGCPKCWFYTSLKTFWGIPSVAGFFFPSNRMSRGDFLDLLESTLSNLIGMNGKKPSKSGII